MRDYRITGSVTNFGRERKSISCKKNLYVVLPFNLDDTLSLQIRETQNKIPHDCIDDYDESTFDRDNTHTYVPCMWVCIKMYIFLKKYPCFEINKV